MKKNEVEAIQKAIMKGIETALDKMFINPMFPNQDARTKLFHAKTQIEQSIRRELSHIETEDEE